MDAPRSPCLIFLVYATVILALGAGGAAMVGIGVRDDTLGLIVGGSVVLGVGACVAVSVPAVCILVYCGLLAMVFSDKNSAWH